jgi:phosphatidylserine/phosphatidylglycerophosphate/cardiolipin synthase-like enzyme
LKNLSFGSRALLFVLVGFFLGDVSKLASQQQFGPVRVWFSPKGGCRSEVCNVIDGATKSLDVVCFQLRDSHIRDSLINAHNRGVVVRIVADRTQQSPKSSDCYTLSCAGVMVFIDPKHAIQHNKYIIQDGARVLTGSFNFTSSAEYNNAENLLEISDSQLAAAYEENFQLHLSHSWDLQNPPIAQKWRKEFGSLISPR